MEKKKNPQAFTLAVEGIIRSIRPGQVMSYGAVAAAAGNPRAARQVVRVLRARSEAAALPWWRVVSAPRLGKLGRIGLKGEGFAEQAALLRAEGLCVSPEGDVDLMAKGEG